MRNTRPFDIKDTYLCISSRGDDSAVVRVRHELYAEDVATVARVDLCGEFKLVGRMFGEVAVDVDYLVVGS